MDNNIIARIYMKKVYEFYCFYLDSLIWKISVKCWKKTHASVKTLTALHCTDYLGIRLFFSVEHAPYLNPLEYVVTLRFIWALTAM